MITIYVGDVGEYLSKLSIAVDSNASLISQENFSNLSLGTYYTSIADVGSLENFGSVLQQATKIVYAPPEKWSDERKKHSVMKQWTEDYLNVFRFRCEINNFVPTVKYNTLNMLSLADTRRSTNSQLWVAGCSISHGVGVDNHSKFGQLLANKLKLEVSSLTQSGSSIIWAADQILRSDIRPNDIVVWGLTSLGRLPYYKSNQLFHISASAIHRVADYARLLVSPETLTSDHLFYQSLISVFQVINFCKKNKATLILAPLLDDNIAQYLANETNLVMLYKLWGRDSNKLFIDQGTDNEHPGVQTHQFYANEIYQKIQQVLALT
jgi:hypothetical protein